MIETFGVSEAAGRQSLTRRIGASTLLAILVGAAALHIGREVFIPLAIATLIAFALSPMVAAQRRRGIPSIVAVLLAVTAAFAFLGAILTIMATQLGQVAVQLPTFQSNILEKLQVFQSGEGSSGVMGRLVDLLARISDEIGQALPDGSVDGTGATALVPVQVAVVENQSPWTMLRDIVLPIISPVVTAGLVIVVVIFMLLERDKLRDRFIRLVGSNDLHRTTEMMKDAGSRVARYLLLLLLVNVIYAVPIGIGLWLIGVPNALLWALMTLVLRFLPYIGTFISAVLPLFVAFAVSPDWSMVLYTMALFGIVELVTSNFVEPSIYGSRTGLSPLAVIVAAIFWTWLWGPLGLILSTPLTVCLVVLGRYLPQFAVFDILFGDEPVLLGHVRLYQRLLTGEVVESVSGAEEALENAYLADFHQDVGIPALLLAQADYDRGVLSKAEEERIAQSATKLVEALEPAVADELAVLAAELAEAESDETKAAGDGVQVVVAGGRSRLDDVASRMLGQALAAEGAEVTPLTRGDLLALTPDATRSGCLVLSFLDPNPARGSLLIVRRIKRAMPGLRVGVVIWQMPASLAADQGMAHMTARSAPALLAAEEIGADFVATSMETAMSLAFADESPKPIENLQKRPPRRLVRQQPVVAAG